MLKLQQFLRRILLGSRVLTKKIYTMGFVVVSACMAIAVVMLGVSGFAQVHRPTIRVAYEAEEEDIKIETLEEQFIDAAQQEETSSHYLVEAYILAYQRENNENSDKPSMQQATDEEERQLRSEPNNISEKEVILISEKDYEALTRIVEAEATGEDIIGKIMVANVVLNRVENRRFPNSIYDVIHQKVEGKAQFSPISNGRYARVKVSASTKKAVERALNGEDYSKGALFFMARRIASENGISWFDGHLTKVATHGAHEFYKY